MTRALLLLLTLAAPAGALEVPFLSGRVNDTAGMLSESSRQGLDTVLKDFETRTGHQAVVLTIPSLEGAPIEDFSLKVARTWVLGRKGQNDGVLFLISKNDRKLRIEVGHGLEGNLPDALAGRIIQDAVVPRFRSGDYDGGITAGVNAIIGTVEGTYAPPPASRRRNARRNDFNDMGIIEKLMMSAFVFGILGLFEFVGLVAPGMGWFLYFFLIPFWASFPMAIWGVKFGMGCLMTHLIGFPFIKGILPHTAIGKNFRQSGNKVYYGNSQVFAIGGGLSSSGGGFSSGGGGFSGGGGSFGGGGSSGSW